MIEKRDWDDAADAWMLAERERLGGPPTKTEILAYQRGKLSAPEAARVRALLVYYPELTSELIKTKPARPHSPRLFAIAASVVIALLAGLLAKSHSDLERARKPYVQTRFELRNELTRGGQTDDAPYELPPGEKRYLLAPVLSKQYSYTQYRIDIVELTAAGPITLWSAADVRPVEGAFELSVPNELVASGRHRIDISGIENGQAHLLESFLVRIANR